MTPRQLRPAVVLATWTLVVWTTRLRNIWTDESLATAGQIWRTVLALVFTAFAAGVVALWARARRHGGHVTPRAAVAVRAFAGWTVAVWLVRGVQIAVADHGGAFVAVHTALAAVSVALAVWADRAVARGRARREPVAA